ncbi:ATP-binding protein [Streptomyces sp. M10(2022)]
MYVNDDGAGSLPMPGESPRRQLDAATRESGRGLLLVEGLATRWGVVTPGGRGARAKTVWFTLEGNGWRSRCAADNVRRMSSPESDRR